MDWGLRRAIALSIRRSLPLLGQASRLLPCQPPISSKSATPLPFFVRATITVGQLRLSITAVVCNAQFLLGCDRRFQSPFRRKFL
ncbi:hypothetical protein [Nostoc sp. 'Peltigera membranacea cyanobiont' 213]|uniref:hypothetical protein n=1 Tax=Nostoc sp. 'Peltigera membranacea cyanobiont' 213 TaxID=2014530 RepID=UPI00167CD013|nr:hypothetical protein [Nostoc sp. 'Peltigera membranacea cyanobiont' 213]